MFRDFIGNLAIDNAATISDRYGEITSALNKEFRDTVSPTANTLQVGSFGRKTGINGISDLDMLYIMPNRLWDVYKDRKQYQLLSNTKRAIAARYPKTKIRVDRLVVTVTYTNFHVEVQPVFEQDDGSFKYPDTHAVSWKTTKPREEMEAVADLNEQKNGNLRRLCKMVRAWRNTHGMAMGGLLIDTLAYNFLSSTTEYDTRSYEYYDWLGHDFFKYLSELPEQSEYAAPGSQQRVKVKKQFQRKAKKAHQLCLEAIAAEGQKGVNDKWKRVYGRQFPANKVLEKTKIAVNAARNWRDTEEFIEDKFPVDIRFDVKIDCEVTQNGFRSYLLREMLTKRFPLLPNKSLRFYIDEISVPEPYEVKWKVLNRGDEAQRRDCIRGQICTDTGRRERTESTNFRGAHLVDCYIVKDDVVVAKDRIDVPITLKSS